MATNTKRSYWSHFILAVRTITEGLQLTGRHLQKATRQAGSTDIRHDQYFELQTGITTVQYPHQTIPVPTQGRYQLHNEIDDCIVCDKCAKVCPVDCIEIEGIKAPEEWGKTSDGTPKRIYAARFDIDMAKCCFCGLCTTVCPTECLTMTSTYDFSVFDVQQHTFSFATLSAEDIAEKKRQWEAHQLKKQEGEKAAPPTAPPPARPKMPGSKP